MMPNLPRAPDPDRWGIVGTLSVYRSDLLRRVVRWTCGRKIRLCTGLSGNVVLASEVILVHRLSQEEIDRWMDAYRRRDFEALKIGYGRKRTPL